jgi:4,5-dihydroxyphthalate decarboxylase
MLLDGEIDALFFYLPAQNVLDRSMTLEGNPAVRWLFPDPLAEGVRYYRKTGLFPVNHCVVVRRAIFEKHPWVALNLYAMFVRAKELAARRLADGLTQFFRTGALEPSAREALAHDPMTYGVKANRVLLETIARYLQEQHLTTRLVALEEIFAPATLGI